MLAVKWREEVSERARRLASLARRLKTASPWPDSPLPALWFLTDEARQGDPVAAARALPRGTGIVLRHYRHPSRTELAEQLAEVARQRGLWLMIGADAVLARAVKAHGVHLPRWAQAHRVRPTFDGWLTASVHSRREIFEMAKWRPDGLFLAPVFETLSHKSAQGLGAMRFSALAHIAPAPVIALGGLTEANGRRLIGTGAMGLAAIGAFLPSTDKL